MAFQFEIEVYNGGVTEVPEVRQLLSDDPKNSEFLDMEKELVEVINFQELPVTDERCFDPCAL
ncbi:hypothetical protein ACS0TY_001758 [Phlomoides rotata]